jgi:excisionase family DNA binding protein
MSTAMAKRPPRLATAATSDDSDVVAVLVPTGWMKDIRDKLDRILRRTEDGGGGGGPLPPKAAPAAGEYTTRKQAAEIMGYSKSTVSRLITKKLLRASGPKLDRIRRSEIDRFMAAAAEREVVATDEAVRIEAEVRRIVDDE